MNVIVPSAVQMLEVAPYFLVPDVVATSGHYRDVLGFSFDRYYGDPPSFCIVSRDGIALMLKQAEGAERQRCSAGSAPTVDAYIWVTDLAALAAELHDRGADIVTEPASRSAYQGREMHVRDLDGRIICFGELDG